MTTLMAKAADKAEVVLIQEPNLRCIADIREGNLGQKDTGAQRNRGSCVGGWSDGDHSRGRQGVTGGGMGGSSSKDGHGQREGSSGRWEIGNRDNNFLWVCSDGPSRIRPLIGIDRGVRWRDYGGLRHPDIVSIKVLPNPGPAVRIINVYNRNTLRSVNLLDELQHAKRWIVAGDMNAHHPRGGKADREPSEDWRHVLEIVNAGTLAIEPGTITCIGSAGQRSSTIDLMISGP
jgi:hypothetical protein